MKRVITLDGIGTGRYSQKRVLKFLRERYGGEIALELGPGRKQEKLPHATIGLNESADPMSDIYADLNYGLPFLPDECIREIHSNQTLEHIKRENFIHLMNEMWRVLVPGGIMEHNVPDYRSPWAWGDPTHFNVFTPKSFQYFCQREDGTPFVERFSDYGIKCNFIMINQFVRIGLDIVVQMRKP